MNHQQLKLTVATVHEIKNGLAKEKQRREANGYQPDEEELVLNDLFKEVAELGLGSHFISFTRFMGINEGFKLGVWTGIFIGIFLTFLTLLVQHLLF